MLAADEAARHSIGTEPAGEPEFTADAIRLTTVLQELGRKPPVAVILEPQLQPVRPAEIAQTTHVLGGNAIRDQSPQIPQEAVRLIGAANDAAGQDRQPRQRVVAVPITKDRSQLIGPVLGAHFVAVGDHVLPGAAIAGRHPPQELADEGIEMQRRCLPVHLVHFQT